MVFARYDLRADWRFCERRTTEVHEVHSRGRGGDITDETNCLALCRRCHGRVTENPDQATLLGLLVPSSWPGYTVPAMLAVAAAVRAGWAAGQQPRPPWIG